jgi:uncharacterized RmlC-like cupin family protein
MDGPSQVKGTRDSPARATCNATPCITGINGGCACIVTITTGAGELSVPDRRHSHRNHRTCIYSKASNDHTYIINRSPDWLACHRAS